MATPTVAVFCMDAEGHFQRLRPVVATLAGAGLTVYVFTSPRFAARVEASGGTFVDLTGRFPIEEADDESRLMGSRYVSFAAHFAEPVTRAAAALSPSLVVYDTFAVIGRVVAGVLGIPAVNVCAGHAVDPARIIPLLESDPTITVSDACLRAVGTLGERYGLADAGPFCHVSGISPHLNVYCEPPEFLPDAARPAFEPIAFFGSLSTHDLAREPSEEERAPRASGENDRVTVYASFGTIIWRFFASDAWGALRGLTDLAARRPELDVLVSLGRAVPPEGAVPALASPNVRVADFVDQWVALREADAFLTHHGLNSTHESIALRTPMLSYPFWWDQPSLATRCQELGVAVPLVDEVRGGIGADHFERALARVAAQRDELDAALERAVGFEHAVIAGRDAVVERIAALSR